MRTTHASSATALADAAPRPFWTDGPDAPVACEPLTAATSCDLLIVGGGLTGLWAAIEAKAADPSADVVLLEAYEIAFGASGRNGGFFSESLTHGVAHGLSLWPREMPTLLRLGRENISEIIDFLAAEGIDARLRMCGKTAVAVKPHQVAELRASTALHAEFGESAVMLDADEVRADVDSPTYLAGMRVRSGGGLLDPALLCWGLFCSTDAIIPMWANMLIVANLSPFVKAVYFGDENKTRELVLLEAIQKIDADPYIDQRVVVKGCGDTPIGESAFIAITQKLRPVVKSIMYGEPCSTVPVYKKK